MSKKRSRIRPAPVNRAAAPSAYLSPDRWLTVCAWGATLALFTALAWPFVSGLTYAGDDLDHFHLPLRQFYWQCLHDGDSFDWLPHVFCGFYLTGEGQIGAYHPLHLLLYRALPFEFAFNLGVLLSYPFMFAGMVLLLRRTWCISGDGHLPANDHAAREPGAWPAFGLPMHAALFGAMLFTFSGFCLLHFMHTNGIAIVAHMPWLLWAIDVLVRGSSGRRRVLAWAGIAALTASQLLLGYPQYVWISSLAELFWLWLAWDQTRSADSTARRKVFGLLGCYGVAKALGVLLGAIQLLPTYDHLAHSQREAAGANVAHFAPLHPSNVVQFVAPYLLRNRVEGGNTHEFGLYAGAIPLLLLAWLFWRRRELGSARRTVVAVALFGAVAFVLALGKFGGLYYLQTLLPIVGNFRVAARYIVLVHLAIAILAAVALGHMTGVNRRSDHGKWRGAWHMAGFSLLAALLLRVLLPSERLSTWSDALLGPALLLAAAVVTTWSATGRRWAWSLLLLCTAADIGYYGLSYAVFPGATELSRMRDAAPQATSDGSRLATGQPNERGQFNYGNLWILNGARMADGYAGLLPANRLNYRTAPGLRLANVSLALNAGKFQAVPDPLPRVRMVSRAVVSDDPGETVMSTPPESLGATVLVETTVQLDGLPGEASLQSERPGNLVINVDAPGTQMLVIADRFHAGWKAKIEGQPAPVYRAYGDFMGVVVSPGTHEVQLRFEPASLRQGRAVTAIAAVVWGLCLLVGVVRTAHRSGEPRT